MSNRIEAVLDLRFKYTIGGLESLISDIDLLGKVQGVNVSLIN